MSSQQQPNPGMSTCNRDQSGSLLADHSQRRAHLEVRGFRHQRGAVDLIVGQVCNLPKLPEYDVLLSRPWRIGRLQTCPTTIFR